MVRIPRHIFSITSRRYLGNSTSSSELKLEFTSTRNIFEESAKALNPAYQPHSYYGKPILESPFNRDIHTMKNTQLNQILQGQFNHLESYLETRTTKLKSFLGEDFTVSNREAVVILCGLSNSYVDIGTPIKKIMAESGKFRHLGQSIFQFTKEKMFLFGDIQYLSSPYDELRNANDKINDVNIIPSFMKTHKLYDIVVPVVGTSRLKELDTTKAVGIRDITCIGSFHVMIGLLVLKYGKENVIENFLVPKVFSGESGIINIVTKSL